MCEKTGFRCGNWLFGAFNEMPTELMIFIPYRSIHKNLLTLNMPDCFKDYENLFTFRTILVFVQ